VCPDSLTIFKLPPTRTTIVRPCSCRWGVSGAFGTMMLFHTFTLSFSNCGMRCVSPGRVCARTASPAASATRRTASEAMTVRFMPGASLCGLLQREQPRSISAKYAGARRLGDVERPQRGEHRRDAADLMRVVAPGQNAIGAGEGDRQRD